MIHNKKGREVKIWWESVGVERGFEGIIQSLQGIAMPHEWDHYRTKGPSNKGFL